MIVYEWDLLKAAALKRSTKGAMTSFFCRALSTNTSSSKAVKEMQYLKELPKGLLKFV